MAMMVMTQISLPTSNGHAAVKKLDINDMGSGDNNNNNNNNVHYHHDPDSEGRATAADLQSSLKNVNFGSNGSHAPEAESEVPTNGNNGDEQEESENGEQEDGDDSEADESQEDFLPVAEPASAYASETVGHSSSTSHTPDDPSTQAKSPSAGALQQGASLLQSASFQSTSSRGEQQQHSTVLTSAPLPQSQFLLTISAPSQSGHYESSSEPVGPYQHQGSQIGEAPMLGPLILANRDACQLPECVISRANAGLSCAVSGGAQLEHLLARVKYEKTMSRARAWEEGSKAKAHNRYTRDESKITAWENLKKAKAEARMSKAQEHLDKKRAKHFEKMKNAVASAHCKAQEKRAAMEARRAEEIVKAEEVASRIRATGKMPRRCLCLPF